MSTCWSGQPHGLFGASNCSWFNCFFLQSFDTVSSSIVSWIMETADAAGGTTPAIPLHRETLKTLTREVMREESVKEKPGESSSTHPSGD